MVLVIPLLLLAVAVIVGSGRVSSPARIGAAVVLLASWPALLYIGARTSSGLVFLGGILGLAGVGILAVELARGMARFRDKARRRGNERR